MRDIFRFSLKQCEIFCRQHFQRSNAGKAPLSLRLEENVIRIRFKNSQKIPGFHDLIRHGSFYFFSPFLTTDHRCHSTGWEYLACPISRWYANACACRKTHVHAYQRRCRSRENRVNGMAPISNRSSRANHPYFTDTRVHTCTHSTEAPTEREFTVIIDHMTIQPCNFM